MKILIVGSNGQLANDLIKTLKDEELILVDIPEIDITNRDHFTGFVEGIKPQAIINTAAFHNVDLCEDQRRLTFDVNCCGALNGALAAEKAGARYVFYSSDYVFGADRTRTEPYRETDPVGPLSVYGWSKAAGEIGVLNICPGSFVIRSSGLYGEKVSGKGYNFPGLMLKLAGEREEVKVVNDQRLTPTHTLDLAKKTRELLKTDHYGVYHLTNEGDCTWYEFTKKIFELAKVKTKLTPVTSAEFPTRAERPGYSVLDNEKLRFVGIKDMKPWQEAIEEYLKMAGLI